MTSGGRVAPDDLRVALALFSRAKTAFESLDVAERDALVGWIDESPTDRERADRIAEVAVRANAADLVDLMAERGIRQRATTANGGDGGN